jgi:hypothetical protein
VMLLSNIQAICSQLHLYLVMPLAAAGRHTITEASKHPCLFEMVHNRPCCELSAVLRCRQVFDCSNDASPRLRRTIMR